MAGLIPQTFIDDLIARTDIVEIVGARLPLKKKGKEYSACCPFHNEKTPSFTVSENKQFYHCFGCGAHGTALGFIMEYESLEFVDAVEALAAEYNLDVPREQSGQIHQTIRDDKKPLYEVLNNVALLFQQQLKTSEKAIQYLKQRGLTGEIAKVYKLGYAPDSWDFLTDEFKDSSHIINNLCTLGLLVKKDNGQHYDRFRDRIIFPITDRRGRIIGFGGRILDQGEPKYLNSPESPVFHKGQELYGVFEAKQAVRNLERIIIVEGYMDVVALAQNDILYAVASLGTATTTEQIQKTFRAAQEIIFCYDGDTAGTKAAWRALENTLPIIRDGQVAKFLFLPEKEDPDSMIRKEGKENFERRLNTATPLSDFMFNKLKQKADITSDDGKAKLYELAKPLLSKMNDGILKTLLMKKLSDMIGLSTQDLMQRLPPGPVTQDKPGRALLKSRPQKNRQVKNSKTRIAIALLIQNPALAKQCSIPDEFKTAITKGLPLLHQLHNTINQSPDITPPALLERFRDTNEESALQLLYALETEETKNEKNIENVFKEILLRLEQDERSERIEVLSEKESKKELTDEEKQEFISLLSGN